MGGCDILVKWVKHRQHADLYIPYKKLTRKLLVQQALGYS